MSAHFQRLISLNLSWFLAICTGCIHPYATKSLKDPLFKFSNEQTVGLACTHTISGDIDPLLEKSLIVDCRIQLSRLGYATQLIGNKYLVLDGGSARLSNMETYPDLLLTIDSGVDTFTEVVPEQSHFKALANEGTDFILGEALASASHVGEHEVTLSETHLTIRLWSGAPDYKNEVWRAQLLADGDQLDQKHTELVSCLFNDEFPNAAFWQR